jgi:CcmD family protein
MNWYLFFGYAVFWILIAVYIFYLQRKQFRIIEDLKTLEESLK